MSESIAQVVVVAGIVAAVIVTQLLNVRRSGGVAAALVGGELASLLRRGIGEEGARAAPGRAVRDGPV